jgi:hypothetical protein
MMNEHVAQSTFVSLCSLPYAWRMGAKGRILHFANIKFLLTTLTYLFSPYLRSLKGLLHRRLEHGKNAQVNFYYTMPYVFCRQNA